MIDVLLSDRLYNPQLISPFNTYNVSQYGSRLYSVLFVLFFVICVVAFFLMFIWGGYKWITSGGVKDKLESARSTISNALTGLLILLILWVIIQIVNTVFGINIADVGSMSIGSSTSTPTPIPTYTPTQAPTLPPCRYCSGNICVTNPSICDNVINECSSNDVDLIIDDIRRYPVASTSNIEMHYCNVGCSSRSETFTFYFFNLDDDDGLESNYFYPYDVPDPGQCAWTGGLTCSNINACEPTNMEGTVDWRNTIPESNEGNNTYTEYIP